jgi:molecular chaperone DnaJ
MNLKEAYAILELPVGSEPDAAKKKYRELTKKYHPDINKELGAEEKFKKINEAYQCVQNGKGSDPEPSPYRYQQERIVRVEHIKLSTTISFKDSVFGCKKELKFTRTSKCGTCNGNGEVAINNGCTTCGGRGQHVVKNGNSIQNCTVCYGKSSTESCKACNSDGSLQSEVTVNVNIPGGVQSGNTLRLQGMGNYMGAFMLFEQNSDVHLQITVTPEPGLSIKDNDVVSFLELSMVEALEGCTKEVKTVDGNKKIEIVPLSRHHDEVRLPKLGVNKVGAHKVILDVLYPKDTFKLIEMLKESEK